MNQNVIKENPLNITKNFHMWSSCKMVNPQVHKPSKLSCIKIQNGHNGNKDMLLAKRNISGESNDDGQSEDKFWENT